MATLVNQRQRARVSDDERAFEALFAAEYGKVVAIAYRILVDRHAAEDVAQDVFYDFHRRHSATASWAPAWLHKAAAHTAYNTARQRDRRDRRSAEHERAEATRRDELDPQRAVEASEQRQALAAALGRLSERSASVLILRYGGLSYAEVAAALGVGVNQVGTLLQRAETALRKELSHDPHR